jgi:Na+-transporting NADH:ubiquinone oxidoreductase subunit E
MEHYLSLFVKSVFIENMALSFFLGMCTFLAISKKIQTAISLGIAVVFVQAVTVPVNNLLWQYLLKEGALSWTGMDGVTRGRPELPGAADLHLYDCGTGASHGNGLRQIHAGTLQRPGYLPALDHRELRRAGGALFMQQRDYNFPESVVYGVGSGFSWALAIVLLAAVREKMKYSDVPPPCRVLALPSFPLA